MTLRPQVRSARDRIAPSTLDIWIVFIVLSCILSGCAATEGKDPGDEPRVVGMPSQGGDGLDPRRSDEGALSLVWENDFFTGQDENYTNGITVGYLTPPLGSLSRSHLLRGYSSLFHFLPGFGDESREERMAFALVHSMFTPDDIELVNPPLDDQPYAGIASLDQSFISRGDGEQHSWLLRLGWVGPRTSADDLQISVHELIDSSEPLGWSTQLPDEGVVNLGYEYRRKLAGAEMGSNFSTDAMLAVGASAGTYFTGANLGVTGRIGFNLADPLGVTSPQRGPTSEGFRCGERGSGFRIGLNAGAEGFAIAHYLPLDGTVFRDSRSVDDRAPLVGSVRAGIDLGLGRFGIGFSYQAFTESFETERSRNEFGTIVLSWSF